jgi:hypothetical protein
MVHEKEGLDWTYGPRPGVVSVIIGKSFSTRRRRLDLRSRESVISNSKHFPTFDGIFCVSTYQLNG